jgi:hypothetical protein
MSSPAQTGRLSKKFYCVTRGHITGIFTQYGLVELQIRQYSGCFHQSAKGHLSDAHAHALKLGVVYWRDYTEHATDRWNQETEHAEFVTARDDSWQDPCYYNAKVDDDNMCHTEERRQRENRKRKGVKNAYDSTTTECSGEGEWFMDELAFSAYKPGGQCAESKPALSYIIQRMQHLHLEIAARQKNSGSPAKDLMLQWAKEEASQTQHVCLSVLDDPCQTHHANVLQAYHQDASARAHNLRRTPFLFDGIALSEKTCVCEWDRTEEIERDIVRTIIGVKQTLKKEEANSSHRQVNTKNTKEEANTSRARAIDRDMQVHPSPPRKKTALHACGSRDEAIKGLSTLYIDKTQAQLNELNEDAESTFQAFLKSKEGSHLQGQVQVQ